MIAGIAPTVAGFDVLTLVALAVALGGVVQSQRMLHPNRDKIVSDIRHNATDDADKLLGRYRELLERADADLRGCHERINDLERREAKCEARADHLAERVAHLESVIRRHGLNGQEGTA